MFWKDRHVILAHSVFASSERPLVAEKHQSSSIAHGRRDSPTRTLIARVNIATSSNASNTVAMMELSMRAAIRIPMSSKPVDKMIPANFRRLIPRGAEPDGLEREGLFNTMRKGAMWFN
jgi:hypothetical protein